MGQQLEGTPAGPSEAVRALERGLRGPAFKYVGFTLLMSWHYVLWFEPHMFGTTPLLDDSVTVAWLVNLGSTVMWLLAIAFALGRRRHLSDLRGIAVVAGALTSVLTCVLCLAPQSFETPAIAWGITFLLGATEAVMWICWGERCAATGANFSLHHIGVTFGATLVITVGIAWVLPPVATTLFAAALPLASVGLLTLMRRDGADTYPVLLPRSIAQDGLRNIVSVSAIAFVASVACYFLVAIIPWETLPTAEGTFTLGIACGGAIILGFGCISVASKGRANIFTMIPWFLMVLIAAYSFFLSDPVMHEAAFIMATGVSSLFEVLLIMYFGIMTAKGYVTPAVAFAFSAGFARAGIAVGNTWASAYELMPAVAEAITPETSLMFICLIAALLIPLVKREYAIVALTSEPPTKDEVDRICEATSEEFGLSARESEILGLIARGHTATSISEKLVISPYTVNTHVRHIYEKMQIHKRSELLNYLNGQRSDF
ncbi:helix-turn-helix transcriptional regulator [Berryella wangjianweii]|uniref:Helix-turn-helix transcriptional regulator n=1 Tax=Berryella wangjianweii TaxID=2734634 RepID=A0A6M8J5T5_9ACTN|nr:helix-turn-helix transcriptional regulator [Berryella wangjianweii]QKF07048.1 helix-turn-helix transcriptional regulator [Berryella wangjianweii]